jgi:hypothetical protein
MIAPAVVLMGVKNFSRPLGYPLAMRGPGILVGGTHVLLRWDEPMPGVGRPGFECPVCRRRCRHLYLRQLACRRCCGLDYSSRHTHRSVPGLHRVLYLHRKIGASCVRSRRSRPGQAAIGAITASSRDQDSRGEPGRASADRRQMTCSIAAFAAASRTNLVLSPEGSLRSLNARPRRAAAAPGLPESGGFTGRA